MNRPDPAHIAVASMKPEQLDALCDLWRSDGRAIWLTVQGRSMIPTILPGRRIQVLCNLTEAVPGRIIVYRDSATLIVHRLVAVETDCDLRRFLCLGDGNVTADRPVAERDVLGVVVGISTTPLALRLLHAVKHPRRHLRYWLRHIRRTRAA